MNEQPWALRGRDPNAIGGRHAPSPDLQELSKVAAGAISRSEPRLVRNIVVDLTQETALHTLIKDEEIFRTILEQMADALLVLDPGRDKFLFANPQACRLLGYPPEELLETPVSIPTPNQLAKLLALSQEGLSGSPAIQELTLVTKEGAPLHAEIAATAARVDGQPCLIASVRDIQARLEQTNQLVNEAMHDHLTGLPNRALFEDRFEVALKRRARTRGLIAVILFDLDGFKVINDTFGHNAGDAVLQTTAEALKHVLRPSDTAARFGGDEFIVLCEDVRGERNAIHVATRIRDAVAGRHKVGATEAEISISMGIAVTAEESASAGDLVSNADAALYRAKRNGRGRYELFDERMRARAQERMRDEIALQRAVSREELRLVYQPQVDLKTGEVVGAEALLRWQHPERGLLQPAEFIGLAEETNLIMPIGSWVLRTACLTAQLWRADRPRGIPLAISVNVSAKQLAHSELVDDVATILEETGTDPSMLCLEITESVIGADAPTSIRCLHSLKDLGVCLVMDDFGKGFSSLSYLRSLPVEMLKIDQSFVLGESKPNDKALLQAAVDMAHALDLKVVAEGVENSEQLNTVRRSGSDLAQGFFFGQPEKSLAGV